MEAKVFVVSRIAEHTLSKPNDANITLAAGLGVEGDAHQGETVTTAPGWHTTRAGRTCAK